MRWCDVEGARERQQRVWPHLVRSARGVLCTAVTHTWTAEDAACLPCDILHPETVQLKGLSHCYYLVNMSSCNTLRDTIGIGRCTQSRHRHHPCLSVHELEHSTGVSSAPNRALPRKKNYCSTTVCGYSLEIGTMQPTGAVEISVLVTQRHACPPLCSCGTILTSAVLFCTRISRD